MGMVNFFAENINDKTSEFLTTYREGQLAAAVWARALDDKLHPHCQFLKASLEHDYIIFEIASPLTKEDVSWMYQRLLVDRVDPDRAALFEYIWSVIGPGRRPVPEHKRTQRLWEKVKAYRKALEIPRLAFKHYDRSAHKRAEHTVDIVDEIVVIQYNTHSRRPRTAVAN